MKTLSGLDASFLYLETAETPMHVGSLHLYELPADFRGSFHRAVTTHIARRLHLAPIFTRRLSAVPLALGHPAWTEAESVDLGHHIRKASGKKLSLHAVEAEAARLHGQCMDRDRPLWEFHVFERVETPPGVAAQGRLVAFYTKIHHAALDGKGGALLAQAIMDLTPEPRDVPPPGKSAPRRGKTEQAALGRLGEVVSSSFSQYFRLARALPTAASSLGAALKQQVFGPSLETGAPTGSVRAPMGLAPKTLFNTAISAQRNLATASLPFAECRALAQDAGGSFNDLVLWLCATALRTYLPAHGGIPAKSLVAAMPISLRQEGNSELNTQASMALATLGTHLADPLARMRAIQASTGRVKGALGRVRNVLPTDYPSLLAPWLVGGVARAAYKVYGATGLDRHLPMLANLVISNVPGPQVPLYLAGARMLTYYPVSIVTHGLALNITVQTYAGHVDFGMVAASEAVPDLRELTDGLHLAFEQARALWSSPPVATDTAAKNAAGSGPRPRPRTVPAGADPQRPRAKKAPASGDARRAVRTPPR